MGYVIVPQEVAYQIDQHTVGGKKPAPIEVLVYFIICLQGFVHLGPGSLPSTVGFHWQEFWTINSMLTGNLGVHHPTEVSQLRWPNLEVQTTTTHDALDTADTVDLCNSSGCCCSGATEDD